jgi:carboxypeptidase Q
MALTMKNGIRKTQITLIYFSLFLLLALNTKAQTFTVDNPVLREIWREGTENSMLQPLAQVLSDSIGPRLTGTPLMKSGQDWLLQKYKSWGIDARNEQYGTWKGWRRGSTHIDLLEPRVRSLEGIMLSWSAPTKGDVTATTIILPDLADSAAYARWFSNVKGKFVLVSPAQPTCRPDTNYRFFATKETFTQMDTSRKRTLDAWAARIKRTGMNTEQLFLQLERSGALGIITSVWQRAWGVTRIFGVSNEKIPVVNLSCEDYGLVFRLTENNQRPRLKINAQSQFLGEVPVSNTLAEMRGTEKPNEYVMLSSHFDSWDGSSGATDNATGTIVMMEAMRILKKVYPNPRRTIVSGHWSGEEQGLNGSRAFTEDHPEVVRGLQALFNQDNGTGRVERISTQGFSAAGGFLASMIQRLPIEISRHISLDFSSTPSSGGSDNAAFICHGAPGFGLSSLNWEYSLYTWHTNRDTYDKIVFDEVRNNAILVAMLVYMACEEPTFLSRERRTIFPMNTQTNRPGTWPACTPAKRKFAIGPPSVQ